MIRGYVGLKGSTLQFFWDVDCTDAAFGVIDEGTKFFGAGVENCTSHFRAEGFGVVSIIVANDD